MKKQLLFALTIISTSAVAVDNLRTDISTNNNLMIHQQNLKNIQTMEEKKAIVEEGVQKYQTCIDKGLLYLGDGASGVDSDNCYDLSNTLNPDSTFRPSFAGHSTSAYSFRVGASGYSSSVAGRFNLDKKCNDIYPGSRSLTYDDIKYVIKDLIAPANIDKKSWVADSVLTMYTNTGNTFISKYLQTDNDNVRDCDGWSTTSTSIRGSILQKKIDGSNSYLDFTDQLCGSTAHLACVYN